MIVSGLSQSFLESQLNKAAKGNSLPDLDLFRLADRVLDTGRQLFARLLFDALELARTRLAELRCPDPVRRVVPAGIPRGDPARSGGQLGRRVATHSTWWVIGKRSKARSPAGEYPRPAATAMSRASAAGSQAT